MSKQTINIGSSANDGTGSTLRAAMDICNDNFNELYARQGPVSGSLFPDVINAVKYVEIAGRQPGDLFCITEIKCAVANGSDYDYLIEIGKVTAVDGSPDAICQYAATVSSLKTGLTLVAVPEYDGSGYSAVVVINWSLLTNGTDYQMPDYEDGSLFAINLKPQKFNMLDATVQVIATDEQTIDGSKELYVFDTDTFGGDLIVYLADIADMKGECEIMLLPSAGDYTLQVIGESGKDINGAAGKMAVLQGAEGGIKSCKARVYGGGYLIYATDSTTIGDLPT